MKHITEDWQMKIFDLLEGNLSEAESKKILAEIEKDSALKHEYVLMKKTYLTPDNIVFAEKQKLYKRGLFVIRPVIYRAAAAAAIIMAGSFAFYYLGQNKQIQQTGTSISNQIKTKPSQPGNSPAEATAKAFEVPKKSPEASKATSPKRSTTTDEIIKDSAVDSEEKVVPYYESPYYVQDEIIVNEMASNEQESDTTTDAIGLSPETMLPVPREKRRTLMYKLLNNSRTMIANLQLPDVSFKALKNENKPYPKIQMEIKTLKTDVIATLID